MSKELGTLVVVVLKAKNLHDRHSLYKQDPYAKITLNGKTHETQVDPKGGQHPEWDAELRVTVYSAKSDSSRQLEVSCWRKEPRGDEEIGKGKVDISDTLKTGEFDDWVTINDVSGTYRGEIYLEMTFFSSGPPPLERRPSKLPPQDRLHHLKQGAVPVAGGSLTVPGGSNVHGPPPAKNDKPFPQLHEPQRPAQLPPLLRPGSEPGKANGHGRRPSGSHTSPNSTLPPSSLTAGRPPGIRHDSNPLMIPGQHSHTLPGNGYNLSYSPPRESQPPPKLSHSPPRQPQQEYNPYVSNPTPPSMPGSGYFPSPQIVVGPSAEPPPFSRHTSGSSYSSAQHSPPRHSPPQQHPPSIPTSTGPLSFPTSPRPPSPTFHPPQSTQPYPPSQPATPYAPSQSAPPYQPSQSTSSYSPQQSTPSPYTSHQSTPSPYPSQQSTPSPYPQPQSNPSYSPPQSTYPPSQPGYPQSQSTYLPPSQPVYPVQGPPQFPSHYPTYPVQPPGGYPPYEYGPHPPGPAQRPFFMRDDSLGELPDPALAQRYSSPLPLPNDTRPHRSNSPFPVPSIPPVGPPQHPVAGPFSPNGDYGGDFQRRREQEERDAEFARRLDMELNLTAP